MSFRSDQRARNRRWLLLASITAATFLVLFGCGGGSSASTATTTPPPPTTPTGSNVQAISVNTGPALSVNVAAVNLAFTSVSVCAPGSTSQCQTLSGIMVDTGSFGLRVLSSALTVSLQQENDGSGNPIAECAEFVDGETWGPVQTADVSIAGEKASALPVQVIGGSAAFANVPSSCSSQGPVMDDLKSLGANGILGVGNFVQDCGPACASSTQNPGFYFSCPAGGCVVANVPVANQVANPVAFFATDNNGVIVELPAATGAQVSLSGSLIFGIGTQSNNAMGSATLYALDPNTGNISTTFKGTTYANAAFLDSGSNAIYFLDTATTGFATCTDLTFWYCPTSTQSLMATNTGANGATSTVNFTVGNADTLTAAGADGVAQGLAGPDKSTFDWGLPFFYGRNVFVAINGRSTPAGQGPFWAY